MKLYSFCSQIQNRLFKRIVDILSFLPHPQVCVWGGGAQLQEVGTADTASEEEQGQPRMMLFLPRPATWDAHRADPDTLHESAKRD